MRVSLTTASAPTEPHGEREEDDRRALQHDPPAHQLVAVLAVGLAAAPHGDNAGEEHGQGQQQAGNQAANLLGMGNYGSVSPFDAISGMAGGMTKPNGEPTNLKMALKKWGFGSKEAARKFCKRNKKSKK